MDTDHAEREKSNLGWIFTKIKAPKGRLHDQRQLELLRARIAPEGREEERGPRATKRHPKVGWNIEIRREKKPPRAGVKQGTKSTRR